MQVTIKLKFLYKFTYSSVSTLDRYHYFGFAITDYFYILDSMDNVTSINNFLSLEKQFSQEKPNNLHHKVTSKALSEH